MVQRGSRSRPHVRTAPIPGGRRDAVGPRRVVAVGLTGGIGAGKSTALAFFREMGALVVSADEVVHGLYRRPEVAARLADRFGPAVLDAEGLVDRGRLGEMVRGNQAGLRWLEELTHPLVRQEIERRIAEAPRGSVVVCEVPLLFESGYESLFDLVVTIEAGPEARRRRSTHIFGPDMFSELEGLQASTERRVKASDLSFLNDGGKQRLRVFVEEACLRARALLPGAGPREGR